MKPSDIIIGRRYVHAESGCSQVWLGIGLRKLYTIDTPLSKHLVVIESPSLGNIGWIAQEGENAREGYWDGFQEQGEDNIFTCYLHPVDA